MNAPFSGGRRHPPQKPPIVAALLSFSLGFFLVIEAASAASVQTRAPSFLILIDRSEGAVRDGVAVEQLARDLFHVDEDQRMTSAPVTAEDLSETLKALSARHPERADIWVYASLSGASSAEDGVSLTIGPDSVPLSNLIRQVRNMTDGDVIVVLETEFPAEIDPSATPLEIPDGVTLIAAARPGDHVLRDGVTDRGLFTEYLLEGLYGAADAWGFGNGDGTVALEELKNFLDEELSQASLRQAAPTRGQSEPMSQKAALTGLRDATLTRFDAMNPPLRPDEVDLEAETVALLNELSEDLISEDQIKTPERQAARIDKRQAMEGQRLTRLQQEEARIKEEWATRTKALNQRERDLNAHDEELAAREADLDARARDLDAREAQLKRNRERARTKPSIKTLVRFAQENDVALWNRVKDSDDPEEVKLYLVTYPEGIFTDIAQDRFRYLLREIRRERFRSMQDAQFGESRARSRAAYEERFAVRPPTYRYDADRGDRLPLE